VKIVNVLCSGGKTGFFFDDQRAIKKSAVPDGAAYKGIPVTEGFKSVRQAGESISVMLVLEDGQIAFGDCAAVQYSGAGGESLFFWRRTISCSKHHIVPSYGGNSKLQGFGRRFDGIGSCFRILWITSAVRYGVTQAILVAAAKSFRMMLAEVVRGEYGISVSDREIPIF
jgi:methylaspartate ammonia-lyase